MDDVLNLFRDKDSNFNIYVEQPGPQEVIIKGADEQEVERAVETLKNYAQVGS